MLNGREAIYPGRLLRGFFLTDGNARRQATQERASRATDPEVASSVVDAAMPVALGTA